MKLKRFLALILTLSLMFGIAQIPATALEPTFEASGSISMHLDSLCAYATSSGTDSEGYTTYEVNRPSNPTFAPSEYYANQLTDYQKKLYRALMDGFCNIEADDLKLKQKVVVNYTSSHGTSISSQEQLEAYLYNKLDQEYEKIQGQVLYNAIQYDHTELFWMHGAALNIGAGISYKNGIATIYWAVEMLVDASELYSSDAALVSAAKNMNSTVNTIITNTPKTSEYDSLVYFNKWLKDNNTYNHPHLENGNYPLAHSAISAFVSNNVEAVGPVCQGYAYAFKYLCDKIGIDCVVITGDLYQAYADPGPHAWNAVELDGKWYGVDVTSNDSLSTDKYNFLVGSDSKSSDPTYKTFGASHVIDDTHEFPTLSQTAYAIPGTMDFTYTIKNNEATITGYTGTKKDVVIPSEVEGYPVKHIGQMSFYMLDTIETVSIPAGVTTIENFAFNGCVALTSITIPNTVTDIGKSAFGGCDALTSVDIPDSVKTIGDSAFSNCDLLETVNLGSGLVTIDTGAFHWCSKLKSITLPNGLKTIGASAFAATALVSVEIPDSVTTLGVMAFSSCTDLKSVVIGKGVKNIGTNTFYYCPSLKEVHFTNSVKTIENAAFIHCASFTDVYFIGTKANKNAISVGNDNTCLTDATWHYFDAECDATCSDCSETRVAGNHTYDNDLDTECNVCGYNRTPSVPVSEFEYEVVANEIYITGYTGTETNIIIPSEIDGFPVVSIEDDAFRNCTSLQSVTISEGIITIGRRAFYGCEALEYIDIPDSVSAIKSQAFSCCSALKTVDLGSGLLSIGESAFESDPLLESLTLPNGLQEISSFAFFDSGLVSLTIPDSVTVFGDAVFTECSALESVTIGKGITYIGASSFSNCSSLKEVHLTSSVKSIESGAFVGCSSITNVYFNGTKAEKDAIAIGNNNTCLTDATWHYVLCEKNGHTYDNDNDDTCNVCDEKRVIVIAIPGDVDGNGAVNNKDMGLLRRYLNDWDVEIDAEAADVNDDGYVNNKDYGLLRRYLNDWDVVLK